MAGSTRHLVLAEIAQTIEVAAPPERVWAVLSDLPRLARWSPQVMRSFVRGRGPVGLGSRLINVNRRGALVWPTRSTVVRFDEGHEIAWKIAENGSTWSFVLEAAGVGTRLTQRREASEGLSETSLALTDRFLGGQPAFQAELQAGMRQTLAGIKHAAEH